MPDAALRIFPDEYVPNAEGAEYHRRWLKANPGEAARWAMFRDAVIATGSGVVPVMSTKYGGALVAAGREHMSISRLVGAMKNPYPPPPPPPSGSYPGSFYTGPLGTNNVVPNDPDGGIVIMWTGFGGLAEDQQRALLLQRISDAGRSMDGVQFQTGQYDFGGQSAEDWINSLGMLPCFLWNTGTSVSTVLSGGANGTIDAVADRLKTKSYRVMMRLMHEFDEPGVPYAAGSDPVSWVAAWRYIVDRIRNRGATKVGYWWCPTEQAGAPRRPIIDACYPGDAYVDWVGSDLYNNVGGFSTPLHGGWAEFDELVNYDKLGFAGPSICTQYGFAKPYVVGETGSRYDSTLASRKADWHSNIDSVCKPHAPNLRGIAFFDQWAPSEGNDWRVDSNQTYAQIPIVGSTDATTYQGWKGLVALPRWRGGIRAPVA